MKLQHYIYIIFFLCLSNKIFAQTKNDTIQWIKFEQLNDSLQNNPKKVLIFLHTDWCTYCKKMLQETFNDTQVKNIINESYYAINLNAETTESIQFEGITYQNPHKTNKTGKYHDIALILFGKKTPKFPTTILLNSDLNVINYQQKYLSIKELLKIL